MQHGLTLLQVHAGSASRLKNLNHSDCDFVLSLTVSDALLHVNTDLHGVDLCAACTENMKARRPLPQECYVKERFCMYTTQECRALSTPSLLGCS